MDTGAPMDTAESAKVSHLTLELILNTQVYVLTVDRGSC